MGYVAELNTGSKMPLIGLGTGDLAPQNEKLKAAVAIAIKAGYRLFDTASSYGSECALGEALTEAFQRGDVRREEVFVIAKIWDDEHDDPVAAITKSLKDLQLEYLDMYLIHWPVRLRKGHSFPPKEEDFLPVDIKSTWQGMEKCYELGLTKAIGLSNFSCKKIEELMKYAKIPPAVIQVEMHPMWQQKKLREYCSKKKIKVCAFSPLGAPNTVWGSNAVTENPVVKEIAHKHGKSVAQVVLKWGIEKGVCVIPKSYNKDRLIENFQVFDFSLTTEDHEKIGKLEQRKNLRGEPWVNSTTSPYKTIEELWDGEI